MTLSGAQALLSGAPGGVSGVITSAGLKKGWAPETQREALTCTDVQSVNQCSRLLLLVFAWVPKSSELMDLEVKIRKITRAWWDETCWTYFSSDKKKTGKQLRWWTLARAWGGVYSVFILEGCRTDSRHGFWYCYFLRCLLRLFCRKTTVDFEKSQVLACFGKSREQEKHSASCSWLVLANWLPGCLVEDGRSGLQRALSNVLQRASGVSDVLSMLSYVVAAAQMEQQEDFPGQEKEHVPEGTFRSSGLKVGLTPQWVPSVGSGLCERLRKQRWRKLIGTPPNNKDQLKWRYSCSLASSSR